MAKFFCSTLLVVLALTQAPSHGAPTFHHILKHFKHPFGARGPQHFFSHLANPFGLFSAFKNHYARGPSYTFFGKQGYQPPSVPQHMVPMPGVTYTGQGYMPMYPMPAAPMMPSHPDPSMLIPGGRPDGGNMVVFPVEITSEGGASGSSAMSMAEAGVQVPLANQGPTMVFPVDEVPVSAEPQKPVKIEVVTVPESGNADSSSTTEVPSSESQKDNFGSQEVVQTTESADEVTTLVPENSKDSENEIDAVTTVQPVVEQVPEQSTTVPEKTQDSSSEEQSAVVELVALNGAPAAGQSEDTANEVVEVAQEPAATTQAPAAVTEAVKTDEVEASGEAVTEAAQQEAATGEIERDAVTESVNGVPAELQSEQEAITVVQLEEMAMSVTPRQDSSEDKTESNDV